MTEGVSVVVSQEVVGVNVAMTEGISVMVSQQVVGVNVAALAPVEVVIQAGTPVPGPIGPPGPSGPPGPTVGVAGPQGPSGQPRWTGEGPPATIIGAAPGDSYLDTSTGDVYVLR